MDDIVFLICSERSGSNLIRVMAGAHSQIEAPSPLHLWRDLLAFPESSDASDGPSAQWPLLQQRIKASLGRHYDQPFAERISTRLDSMQNPSAEAVITFIYRELRARSGKSHLFIKENNPQHYAAQILHSFPNARFVFQVRDPRDVIASAKKLRKGRLGNKFGSLYNAINIWKDDQEFGLKLRAYLGSDRVFFLRYEDLIADAALVLAEMCRFLGLDYEEAMLNYHEIDENLAFADKGKQWKNISRPVLEGNSGNYRRGLSKREIKSIEIYLGPLLERFGYPLDFEPDSRRGWFDLNWPRLMHPFEYWANRVTTPHWFAGNYEFLDQLIETSRPLRPDYALGAGLADGGEEAGPGVDDLCVNRVLAAVAANWERPALRVGGETWLYRELFAYCREQARILREAGTGSEPVIGVYAERHWSAYAGIVTAMLLGAPYVPLNPAFPAERNRNILQRAGVTTLIHAARDEAVVGAITGPLNARRVTVTQRVWPDRKADCAIESHTGFGDSGIVEPSVDADDIAYILFTSGSTGEPKGVAISQKNLGAYLAAAKSYLEIETGARFSQTFDLTFDLSVHDLFVCWSSGAELVVPARAELLDPADYIRKNELTHWFSVPSLGSILRLQNKLGAGSFPSLKSSLFCGEALSREVAADWLAAAPDSSLENWYGPTEATIACTRYAVDDAASLGDSVVPIGQAFSGMTTLILDADNREIEDDDVTGELLLGGPQLASGYLNDTELTAKSFVEVEGRKQRFYRTGDLVYASKGCLHYVGRKDSQVKIRGYRVELSEIENTAREILGGSNVVALSWPPDDVNGSYVICAVEDEALDSSALVDALRQKLPIYMVPSAVFEFPLFPKNSSGKIDRRAIRREITGRFQKRGKEQSLSGDDTEARLMAAICKIMQGLSAKDILDADNLIAAGMDSLNFVTLMLVLEEEFGLPLDQEKVAHLSRLSFGELAAAVDGKPGQQPVLDRKQSRANRAMRFVHEFPGILDGADKPLLFAIGSSGLFRGFNAQHFRQLSRQAGEEILALNIGLPALTGRGITRICRYLRDVCLAKNCRPSAIIYELDPLLVSTSPPPGDIELPESVFSGDITLAESNSLAAEFEWSAETCGDVIFSEQSLEKSRRARWESKRDVKIVDTYAGRVELDEHAVEAWFEGLSMLQELTDRLVCFVHPLNHDDDYRVEAEPKNKLFPVLDRIRQQGVYRLLRAEDFEIAESEYLNINHVTRQGSCSLTAQIYRRMLTE